MRYTSKTLRELDKLHALGEIEIDEIKKAIFRKRLENLRLQSNILSLKRRLKLLKAGII